MFRSKRKPVTIEGISEERRAQLKADIESLYEPDPDSPYERKRIKHQSSDDSSRIEAMLNNIGALQASANAAAIAQQRQANLSQQALWNAQLQSAQQQVDFMNAQAQAQAQIQPAAQLGGLLGVVGSALGAGLFNGN